jgi:uncharacterized damage-inducible protein DinB
VTLAETLLESLRRSIGLTREFIDALPESALAERLPGLPSNTIGAQLWCVVGARESYARAIAAGRWSGFSCSLSNVGARRLQEARVALADSAAAIEAAARDLANFDDARSRLFVDLIEHESAHQGQIIRYLYALRQPFPAGWKARYALE